MTHVPSVHTAAALLSLLRELDVHVRVEGGKLRVNAPKGRLTPELEGALMAKKGELLHLLSESDGVSPRAGAPVPISRDEPLPLSFLQERMWVLDQLQPGHTAYNLAIVTPVTADLDIAMLVSAVRRVIARHEILRARFTVVNDEPRVVVGAAEDTPVTVRDMQQMPTDEQAVAIASAPAVAAHLPFNLATEAPVRFEILQAGASSGALVISAHHIAVDAWSMGLLRHEIMTEYAALVAGTAAPRDVPRLQYVDFAAWQRRAMQDAVTNGGVQFWLSRLTGLPQLSTFTPDRARQADVAGAGVTHQFRWPRALFDDVRALARELDATVYMVLLAAMTTVLARNTGQTDVAVGSPLGTRDAVELEDMLGPILNPLVMRFDVSDDPSFATLVQRARTAVLDGHAHQDVPFELLVQALKPDRSLGHAPLFQVAVVLHNAPDGGTMQIHGGGAIYDVTMFAAVQNDEMTGSIEYRTDLYDADTIARIEMQVQTLLSAAVRDSQRTVSQLPLLNDIDVARIVKLGTPAPVALDRTTVVAQFARTVAEHPATIAVVAGDESLTYAELDRRSTQVAQRLQSAGAGRGAFVALATDRSTAMVVGALGILKAGAAYVPIDVAYPSDRVAFMLRDCGARHVVATASSLRALRDTALPDTVLLVEDSVSAAPEITPLRESAQPDDIAYLIYTSGSTGTPKGVLVPHSALSNFLGAMREQPGLSPADRVLCVTSMSFDISILEVFLPLVTGARTVIAERDVASDGAKLSELIRARGVTVVQSTPSGWRVLMNTQWAGNSSITAIVGGESMPADLARWLHERVRQVWNAYGPTETTVWSTVVQLSADDVITIGRPIANTRIYVLNSASQLAPIGAPGEICIGGDGVTRGYHQRAGLTAERFVPELVGTGTLMYRTGDFGRWRADGRLEHLGRMDGQVKLRGYRIETGEIEAALARHELVTAAVVGVRNASADDPRLVAWVQLHDDAECTTSELRRHLRQTLPDFMIPSMIVLVERFPLTPNAKVDQKALPDPFGGAQLASREYVPPVTATERVIADIWKRLLGVPQAGLTDRFFDLGGHSLLAMRAAGEISTRTGHAIEPRLLFFQTLGQLAEACDEPALRTLARL